MAELVAVELVFCVFARVLVSSWRRRHRHIEALWKAKVTDERVTYDETWPSCSGLLRALAPTHRGYPITALE